MGVLGTLLLFGCLLAAAEALHRAGHVNGEPSRKLVHMTSALLAAALSFVLTPAQIAVLGVAFAVAMVVSRRFMLLRSIHDVRRTTHGEVLFPLGVALLAVVADDRAAFVYGVLVLGVADGLAALVGERFGRRRVRVPFGEESVWGSTAFFAAAVAIGAAVLLARGQAAASVGLEATSVAALLTAAELTLAGGLDNLVLPVLAATAISL